jgi:hypothetical protein
MSNEWKDRWDEIDNATETRITERPHWGLPQMSYLNYEKKQWAPRSVEGLWFDAYTWRLYQQTRLTSIPLLSRMDEIRAKPFYITDTETGRFRYCIPFSNKK